MASIVQRAIDISSQTLPSLLKPTSILIKQQLPLPLQATVAATGFHTFVDRLVHHGGKIAHGVFEQAPQIKPQIIRHTSSLYSNHTVDSSHLSALNNPIASTLSSLPSRTSTLPVDSLTPIEALLIIGLSILTLTVVLMTIKTFISRALFGPTDVIPVHVIDVAVLNDFDPSLRVCTDEWFGKAGSRFHLHTDEINFMRAITERSGIGHGTHFSPGIVDFPPDLSLNAARDEAKLVAFSCLDKLFAQNNINPKDIDILVTNCSLLNPTPSLASMIINHYKMRTDIQSFHLGGMGCGISPLSINVASSCLRLHPKKNPLAVVFSFESITQNIYMGRERAFMVQNALFRLGGAAILLTAGNTNHSGYRFTAPRWTITNSTHIHKGSNTDAYTAVYQDIDKEDRQGVRLDKTLMSVAAAAITRNLQILGPRILPLRAKLDYVFRLGLHAIKTKLLASIFRPSPAEIRRVVVPNFKLAVDHYCVHAGGRAVLTAIQDALSLSDADMKPSRDTLYRFGNTSSSSIWYEYSQVQNTRKPRKGDNLLLIAVGSGFKANLMTFKALRDVNPQQ